MDSALIKAQIHDVERLEWFSGAKYKCWIYKNLLIVDNRQGGLCGRGSN